MRRRVWSTQSGLLVIVGLALVLAGLVWFTVWLLSNTSGGDGGAIANVVGFPVTVGGLAVAVYGLRMRPRVDDSEVLARAARKLLDQVAAAEAYNLQCLLGDTGDTQPADIGFSKLLTTVRWRMDGGDSQGSLDTIASFYRSLDRGRLVILGEAGAGKTVLAIKLLIDLARCSKSASGRLSRIQIPIRLSLPDFPGGRDASPAASRDGFDAWISDHLTSVHSIPRAVATALVSEGWILPILDGLDEMDADEFWPTRAQAITTVLNAPTDADILRPVVLTCRTMDYFNRACSDTGSMAAFVQDATVVTMQSLDIGQIVNWLTYRFPDLSQAESVQERWRPVVAHLRQHPDSPLASSLSSPLFLYLAVTTYQDTASPPSELCELEAAALESHLFSRLIPAVVEYHPKRDGRRYDAEDVARWLRTFANHLARMEMRGFPGADLKLRELWRSLGNPAHPGWGVRWLAAVAIASSHALLLLWLFAAATSFRSNVASTVAGLLAVLGLLLLTGLMLVVAGQRDIHFPRGLRHVSLLGLTCVAAIMISSAFIRLIGTSFVGGLAMGWPLGLAHGLVLTLVSPQRAGRPIATLRTNQTGRATARNLIADGATGLMCAIVWAFTLWAMGNQLINGRLIGLFGGLAIGALTGGRILAMSLWLRHVLMVLRLTWASALPGRLDYFLNWAHSAGLLRLAGRATQFRHRELQRRLTTYDLIPTVPKNAVRQFLQDTTQCDVRRRHLVRCDIPLRELTEIKEIALAQVRHLDLARTYEHNSAINPEKAFVHVRRLAYELDYELTRRLERALEATLAFSHDLRNNRIYDINGGLALALASDLDNVRNLARDRDVDLIRDRALDYAAAVETLCDAVTGAQAHDQASQYHGDVQKDPRPSPAAPESGKHARRLSILTSIAGVRPKFEAMLLIVVNLIAFVINYRPVFPALEGDWLEPAPRTSTSPSERLHIADDRFLIELRSDDDREFSCKGTIIRAEREFYTFASLNGTRESGTIDTYTFATTRGGCGTFTGVFYSQRNGSLILRIDHDVIMFARPQ